MVVDSLMLVPAAVALLKMAAASPKGNFSTMFPVPAPWQGAISMNTVDHLVENGLLRKQGGCLFYITENGRAAIEGLADPEPPVRVAEAAAKREGGIPFSEVESILCPKCDSGEGSQCRKMAGRGVTKQSKLVPHTERLIELLKQRGEYSYGE